MKQMAGYLGGYISKRQKTGRFELNNSIKSLPFFQSKLDEKKLKSAGAQLGHVVNKMFTTLEGKGILRTATEEFLLASEYRPDDELAQEFTRTFRHTFFFGRRYVERYESLKQKRRFRAKRYFVDACGHHMKQMLVQFMASVEPIAEYTS